MEDNARVTMRLVPVVSNVEPYRYLQLRIEDAVSGLSIIHVRLYAQDVLDLLSASTVGGLEGISAWLIGRPLRDKLGFVHVHLTRAFPTWPPDDWTHEGDRVQAWREALRKWADATAEALGCDSASCSTHNTGKTAITFRAYLPPEADAKAWRAATEEILAALPGPADIEISA